MHFTACARNRVWAIGKIMKLGPLKMEASSRFLLGWPKEGGYRATNQDIARILEIGEDVPYNIRRLCHNNGSECRENALCIS
jgi:hypothetical protein